MNHYYPIEQFGHSSSIFVGFLQSQYLHPKRSEYVLKSEKVFITNANILSEELASLQKGLAGCNPRMSKLGIVQTKSLLEMTLL